MPEWIQGNGRPIRMHSCWKKPTLSWLLSHSVWVSISRTYVMSFIMISRRASKVITRKQVVPAVMVAKASVLPFMHTKICRSWRNSCRVSLLRNRKSVSNCCLKQRLMLKLPYAVAKSCCIISVRNTWKKIVEIVIIV